jgi:hypothetical protein
VQEERPLEVTAVQLLSDYKSNQLRADGNYKGKVVQVNGTVRRVTNNAVELEGGKYELLTVDCQFSSADAPAMASLSAGSFVTIKGVCEGKNFAGVRVKNSKIVQ